MKINTTPGETYIVLSTGGCTVTTGAGKQIKKLAAGQDFFTAMTGDSIISDDNASVSVAKGEILSMLNTDGTGAEVQATLRFQPVTSQSALPATGENGVIYLVPNGADAPNQYTEWVWTGAAYEQLGDVSVDLSGYASKKDLGITAIAEEDSGQMIFADSYLITKHVGVSTLGVGECTFSGSTDGSNVVTTTGSLSAGTLGGYDVVTTGGAVITNYIKIVSEVPTLEYAGMTMGAEIRGASFTDAGYGTRHAIEIVADRVSLTNMFGADPYLEVPELRTTAIFSLAGDNGGFWVGRNMRVEGDIITLGGYDSWDSKGIKYIHITDVESTKMDVLSVGFNSVLSLGEGGELKCGDPSEGISMYTNASGIATLRIGSKAEVIGLFGGSGGENISAQWVTTDNLSANTIYANNTDGEIAIETRVTNVSSLGVHYDITARCFRVLNPANVHVDAIRLGLDPNPGVTPMPELYLDEGARITGPGWDAMVQQIQAGSSSGGSSVSSLAESLLVSSSDYRGTQQIFIGRGSVDDMNGTGMPVLRATTVNSSNYSTSSVQLTGHELTVFDARLVVSENNAEINLTNMASLVLGEGSVIKGPGWDTMVAQIQAGGSGTGALDALTIGELNVNTIKFTKDKGSFAGDGISFEDSNLTEISSLGAEGIHTRNIHVYNDWSRKLTIGTPEGEETEVLALYLGEGVHIVGPGWEEMQAAAAATAAEAEQESFTKLIFPPTGTATVEQDPSWITKSHILMETNGGQLNMTQLTATLAYAAQTPLAIAKRTLWLSTSPGTGDAVQWPANAVFPDDQPQDKIQQLNSNSTYWFDITYVGGSDTVLIRKVCSWASTTGGSGPTE